jgi:hypothetical protein
MSTLVLELKVHIHSLASLIRSLDSLHLHLSLILSFVQFLFDMGRPSRRKVQSRNSNPNGRHPQKLDETQIAELRTKGFVVIRYVPDSTNYCTKERMEALVSYVLKSGHAIINDDNGIHEGGDQTRLMKVCRLQNVTGRAAKQISGRLMQTFPHLKLGIAAFLLSKAHGHEQQPHTDVEAGHEKLKDPNTSALWGHVQQDRVPLSVVLTYGHEATLTVWPGSHEIVWKPNEEIPEDFQQKGERIRVPPYSALVFRQDLVHAGSAYTENNLRLHFYMELNVSDFTRTPDTTQPMDEACFVPAAPTDVPLAVPLN